MSINRMKKMQNKTQKLYFFFQTANLTQLNKVTKVYWPGGRGGGSLTPLPGFENFDIFRAKRS